MKDSSLRSCTAWRDRGVCARVRACARTDLLSDMKSIKECSVLVTFGPARMAKPPDKHQKKYISTGLLITVYIIYYICID